MRAAAVSRLPWRRCRPLGSTTFCKRATQSSSVWSGPPAPPECRSAAPPPRQLKRRAGQSTMKNALRLLPRVDWGKDPLISLATLRLCHMLRWTIIDLFTSAQRPEAMLALRVACKAASDPGFI